MLLLLGLFITATAQQSVRAVDDAISMMSMASMTKTRPKWKGCTDCCMDGDRYAPCLDVEACAAKGPHKGKYAFVYSHWWHLKDTKFLKNIKPLKAQAEKHGIDLLMLMQQKDIDESPQSLVDELVSFGFRLVPVDWDLPPGMKYMPSNWSIGRERGWCGPMDLIRLHLFNIPGYDAVVYYDSDIELQGDVLPVLRCAATGRLLTTTGTMSPINVGFIAVKPDERLLRASIAFAREANFTYENGWGGARYAPSDAKYVGAECGQGFIHTLFYKAKTHDLARRCLADVGLKPEDIGAAQVDRCIWNYHGQENCGQASTTFDCSLVRVHHKPKRPQKDCCTKIRERKGNTM